MTDYEIFVKLYDRLNIPYTEEDDFRYTYPGKNLSVTVPKDQKLSPIKGYYGFATTLYFDNDGKFLCQHIWE